MIAFIIETCFLQILRFIWLSTHWSVTKCVKISFNVKGMGFTRKSKVYLGLEKIAPSANSSTDIQKQTIIRCISNYWNVWNKYSIFVILKYLIFFNSKAISWAICCNWILKAIHQNVLLSLPIFFKSRWHLTV